MQLLKSLPFFAVGVGLLGLAGGCVPQDRYDSLRTAYRSQEEQLQALQTQLETARANEQAIRGQLSSATGNLSGLENERSQLLNEIGQLQSEYDALLREVDTLSIGPLPREVESALDDLANQYPDLISFDAQRGMLRFASDFTFALGSADLQSQASQSINALADILTDRAANNFEVQVVGHTDNVPIRRASTKKKHPTNVHLSAHRAIAVGDALADAGVNAARIMVAGYGPYRPVVANGPGGEEANRRVEIFLRPMTKPLPKVRTPNSGNTQQSPPPAANAETDGMNAPMK